MAFFSILPSSSFAQVSFKINTAELLKNAAGVPIPAGEGLIILAVSTLDDTFTVDPDEFFAGDDFILDRWETSTQFGNDPGILLVNTTGPLFLSGDWTPGDPVALFWFPTLDFSAGSPGVGTSYGMYRHPTGLDAPSVPTEEMDSQPWTTPNDGEWRLLRFWTEDSFWDGSNPAEMGNANLTVVPEPQTYALVAGAALLGFAGFRRYRRF